MHCCQTLGEQLHSKLSPNPESARQDESERQMDAKFKTERRDLEMGALNRSAPRNQNDIAALHGLSSIRDEGVRQHCFQSYPFLHELSRIGNGVAWAVAEIVRS